MHRQSSTICIEGICQDNWKRPRDGERQPLQPEYTHAGPVFHTELRWHRRTWCAIAQQQTQQPSEQNLTLEFRFLWSQKRQPSVRMHIGTKRSRSDRCLGLLGLSSSLLQSLTYGIKNIWVVLFCFQTVVNLHLHHLHICSTCGAKIMLH